MFMVLKVWRVVTGSTPLGLEGADGVEEYEEPPMGSAAILLYPFRSVQLLAGDGTYRCMGQHLLQTLLLRYFRLHLHHVHP
jgi:hypothetical protein